LKATHDFDVVIAGAGPGGCIAARDLAAEGFSVGLFDPGTENRLAKPIVVEVEEGVFSQVGLPTPLGNEMPYRANSMRVISPRGRHVFSVNGDTLPYAIRLDKFVNKLHRAAVERGTKFFGGHRVKKPVIMDGKVAGVTFAAANSTGEAHARIVVDATGFDAELSSQLDPAFGFEFPGGDRHVVLAENSFHRIDPEKARRAVREGIHGDGELCARFGIYGTYSTVYSYLSLEDVTAYVLMGYRKFFKDAPPLKEAIARFKDGEGYYGKKLHGGGGPIRIRHSLDHLVSNGFMAIGEAACQVIPVHGSGVASALFAGHIAAKTAAAALRSGDTSARALWPYAVEYQRTRGRILAAFDVGRLTVDKLDVGQLGVLMEHGIMTREEMIAGAVPRLPRFTLSALPARLAGILKNPGIAPRLARMGVITGSVLRHYARYPQKYDETDFRAWRARKKRLFGDILED
jgi:digeranylgeranylglycerophospholipid reductase